jgi:hypothetical protein
MTIKSVLIRFSLIYIPLLIVSAIVASYFDLKNIVLISAFALWASAKGRCTGFIEKNNRDFTKDEKIAVFWGFFLIALAIDLVFLVIVFLKFLPSLKMGGLNASSIFLLGTMIMLSRAIPAYIAVGVHKKSHLPNKLQKNS